MNLEQIVKETVAKVVAEKKGKDLTGDGKIDSKDYLKARSMAIEKAKNLDEASIPSNVESLANKIVSWYEKHPNPKMQSDRLPAVEKNIEYLMSKTVGNNAWDFKTFEKTVKSKYPLVFQESQEINEDHEDHEVAMAQDSLDSVIRAAMELKTRLGDDEKDIPAWIQDHITNSESYIYQAAKSYHEYNAEEGTEEMNEEYNSEQSAIESASGDKITGTEEDDYGTTLYIGQDPYDQYFIINGEIKHDNFQKGIKGHTIGDLKHYGDGQNHSADDTMHESQDKWVKKDSFDDYVNGDSATYNGEPVTIEQLYLNMIGGARAAKIKLADGSIDTIYINDLDENKMTTNEGRSAEDLKQAQLDQAYASLEKKKENPRLFTKDDIKKTEDRIEKLEAELDALAAKATNESLDEATVRRWQHYAGIK